MARVLNDWCGCSRPQPEPVVEKPVGEEKAAGDEGAGALVNGEKEVAEGPTDQPGMQFLSNPVFVLGRCGHADVLDPFPCVDLCA